jgi:hypothetical protein
MNLCWWWSRAAASTVAQPLPDARQGLQVWFQLSAKERREVKGGISVAKGVRGHVGDFDDSNSHSTTQVE